MIKEIGARHLNRNQDEGAGSSWDIGGLTIISLDESSALLVEVSCPFEGSPTALEEAARLKLEKYEPLRQTLLLTYPSVEILPFIVGALGSWYPPNDRVLSRLHIG